MIRRTTELHRSSAANFLIQSQNAHRTMLLYRHRLLERGFRFGEGIDHDSCYPPTGMTRNEAWIISKHVWSEIHGLPVH